MDYSVLLSTFTLLFLAEMGDKTQLMAMTLAHRYRIAPVIVGTFAAFLLLNLLAVLVGEGVSRLLPREVVLVVAGILFLFFAYRSWTAADESEDDVSAADHRQAWIVSFILIFVAELGDKTQLAMVALAAQSGALWSVFVGGTLALWSVSLVGILVGRTLLRRIPAHWVHRAAALLFFAFGLIAIGGAVVEWANG
ncbi:MAG: TMEM165/GDT1 family protein [Chromatiaceae bacterium]|nr:TMEM165/GDT1 family protein [Chromatiaceae bacterium]